MYVYIHIGLSIQPTLARLTRRAWPQAWPSMPPTPSGSPPPPWCSGDVSVDVKGNANVNVHVTANNNVGVNNNVKHNEVNHNRLARRLRLRSKTHGICENVCT